MSPGSIGGYSIYRRRKPAERSSKLNVAKSVLDSAVIDFIDSPLVGIRVHLIP